MVVGIGGGSPLDASKAIAVLAVNDMDPLELYKNSFANKPLPIAAIPTTSGTGSEVTPYSILTRDDMETKMSFGNDDTFPRLAFLDAGYTVSMPHEVTVNTAVDALSHAVEGYLGKRSTIVSDILALEAVGIFGECTGSLLDGNVDYSVREKLLYASMLGGMVISQTGTTIMHGMGYNLTYFKGIPHGKANGLLMEEYFNFNYPEAREKTEKLLGLLRVGSIAEFGNILNKLLGHGPKLDAGEIGKYAAITMKQRSTGFNIRNITAADIEAMYRKVLG
jgi:alcohol dehydrogenase class IV